MQAIVTAGKNIKIDDFVEVITAIAANVDLKFVGGHADFKTEVK